jgi:hypothetical protein
MDGEVPFPHLLRCNHDWPFCHALTLTRLTLTNLMLIPDIMKTITLILIIMKSLTILFPVTRAPRR